MNSLPSMVHCLGIVNAGKFEDLDWENRYRFEQEWASAWSVTTWKQGGKIALSKDAQPRLPLYFLVKPNSDLLVAELDCLGVDIPNRQQCLKEAQAANIRIYVACHGGTLLYPFPLDSEMLADLENGRSQRAPTVDESKAFLRCATSTSIEFTTAQADRFEFSFRGKGFLWFETTHTVSLYETGSGWTLAFDGSPVWTCANTYGRLIEPLNRRYQKLTKR